MTLDFQSTALPTELPSRFIPSYGAPFSRGSHYAAIPLQGKTV